MIKPTTGSPLFGMYFWQSKEYTRILFTHREPRTVDAMFIIKSLPSDLPLRFGNIAAHMESKALCL
jgi:hypothetical protein